MLRPEVHESARWALPAFAHMHGVSVSIAMMTGPGVCPCRQEASKAQGVPCPHWRGLGGPRWGTLAGGP